MKIRIVPDDDLERFYLQCFSIGRGNVTSDIGFSESIGMSILDYELIAKKYNAIRYNYEIWFSEDDGKKFLKKYIIPYVFFEKNIFYEM